MKGRSGSNRAICIGDRDRAGSGAAPASNAEILRVMANWKIAGLKKFIPLAKNKAWRDAAVWLLSQKEGLNRKLKELQKKRNNRRKKATMASKESRP